MPLRVSDAETTIWVETFDGYSDQQCWFDVAKGNSVTLGHQAYVYNAITIDFEKSLMGFENLPLVIDSKTVDDPYIIRENERAEKRKKMIIIIVCVLVAVLICVVIGCVIYKKKKGSQAFAETS